MPPAQRPMRRRVPATLALLAALPLLIPLHTVAASEGIRFVDVTSAVGITHTGTSYGASWGDFNGDGWPDLWVGNHDSKPTLYLNERGQRFRDVIDEVWSADPTADTHGAQWADFDNDGDQDLVEVLGATTNPDGSLCLGCGRNHLFVNDGGRLVEQSASRGLLESGYARSPLWFDADGDGRLDLLIAATRKADSRSVLYRQLGNGTFERNPENRLADAPWSSTEEWLARIARLPAFDFSTTGHLRTRQHLESARLTLLGEPAIPTLVLLSDPTRFFTLSAGAASQRPAFAEATAIAGVPDLDLVNDTAVADFDGDGDFDLHVSRGPYLAPDLAQPDDTRIEATLNGSVRFPQQISFAAQGPVVFQLAPAFMAIEEIRIGQGGRTPAERTFTLDPADPANHGPAPTDIGEKGGVAITYDPATGAWRIIDASAAPVVDVIATAEGGITALTASGFTPYVASGDDILLLQSDGRLATASPTEAAADSACFSVAAADFDNDMDVDLYLACTGPLGNLPNRLLENDGSGSFRLVPEAGGAAGSTHGRSDAVALADHDRDGFVDIFLTNGMDPTSPFVADGPHQLFRNQGNANHWLEIDLEGTRSNRDGIGAVVTIEAGGVIQRRLQSGGMHRAAQDFARLHFGLGRHTRITRLVVTWPDGTEQVFVDVDADQIIRIREGEREVAGEKKGLAPAPGPL